MFGAYLTEGIKHADPRQWATRFVEQAHAAKRRLAGFGHPYYAPTDPRSDRLGAPLLPGLEIPLAEIFE